MKKRLEYLTVGAVNIFPLSHRGRLSRGGKHRGAHLLPKQMIVGGQVPQSDAVLHHRLVLRD